MSEAQGVHGKPTEGMCCLVTMEDITEEEGNYVEYQSSPSLKWSPALFEKDAIQQLVDTQYGAFIERVKKTDCQAELRRLLATGPPIFLSDKHGLPIPEGDTHISSLYYASDNLERSAKLKDSLEGEERMKMWEELEAFIVGEEKDDEEEREGKEEKVVEQK